MSEARPPFNADEFVGRPLSQPRPRLEIARVAKSIATMISDNLLLVIGLAFATLVGPKLLLVGVHLYFHGQMQDGDPAYDVLNNIDTGIDFIGYFLFQTLLILGLIKRQLNRHMRADEAMKIIFPAAILAVLLTLGILLGLLFFILPGIWFLVYWSVATPALIAEDLAPRRSISRSDTLVRGYFWTILLLTTVGIGVDLAWTSGADSLGAALLAIWPDQHIDWIVSALLDPWGSVLWSVLPVALYYELVALKEGGNVDSVAAEFD